VGRKEGNMKQIRKINIVLLGACLIMLLSLVFLSRAMQAPSCVAPPAGLVSWWPGDGNAFDIIDGNDGTLKNGATLAAGFVGQAFNFDGVDDYVEIPDSNSLDTGTQFTIDAWFNTDDVHKIDPGTKSETQTIVMYGFDPADGKNNPLHIRDGKLYLAIRGYGPGLDDLVGVTSITSNTWYHAAVTYDGTTAKLYLNGALEDSKSASMNMNTNSRVTIGRYQNPKYNNINFHFDGLIDEVEIFNRALSDSEIQDIFDAGCAGKCKCTPPPSNMVSWWPGDGDATDILGGNDGNLINGADFTVGNVGQAFYLDGVDDFVSVPDAASLDMAGSFTIDAWVRLDELRNISTILTKEHSALPLDVNYNLHILNYKLFFALTFSEPASLISGSGGCDAGGCYVRGTTSLTTSDLGLFLHVAAVYDDTNKKLTVYLNGIKDGEATFLTNGTPTTNNEPIRIGKRNAFSAGTNFPGVIDELEIFNRALTDEEIRRIYDAGRRGKCKPIQVAIDIKPGSYPNSINLGSRGNVPVAIFSTACFDATNLDPTSITLAAATLKIKGKGTPMASFKDINGDGIIDLVVHVDTDALELSALDTEAVLEGTTYYGISVRGVDSVRIVRE